MKLCSLAIIEPLGGVTVLGYTLVDDEVEAEYISKQLTERLKKQVLHDVAKR